MNLHVADKSIGASDVLQARKPNLRHYSTQFSARGGNTVCSRTVPSWKSLTRDNECCCIRPEVLEEIRQAIQKRERIFGG